MRFLPFIGVFVLLAMLGYDRVSTASATATGSLTVPISGFAVGSWFDHTSPSSPGAGLVDNSSTMTRYDGTTGWSYNGHAGTDYPTGGVQGYSVVASLGGTVTSAGWANDGFGYKVRLWHSNEGISTLYAHLKSQPAVTVGQSVSRGQFLGYSGNTGTSTGPHLHFGVYNSQSGWIPIDPYGWSGSGSDPWSPNIGYLWSTNPPGYYQGTETAGVFRTTGGLREWHLNNQHSGGSVTPFSYGQSSDTPVTGDWDGDGDETVGVFRSADREWHLRNSNSAGGADERFFFGISSDTPVVGDWDANGTDTAGVWRDRKWYLNNVHDENSPGYFLYGRTTDIPLVGDWNGDGQTTVGVYRPSTREFILNDQNDQSAEEYRFVYGSSGDTPIAGDWDGDGVDTVGVWRGSCWYLKNSHEGGQDDIHYCFGSSSDNPVTGDWDGQ